MYSRDEKSRIKHAFWTAYGQYMSGVPVYTDEGKKKNWLNYKTGVRHISFKTDADTQGAYIGIEIRHRDKEERKAVFGKFQSLHRMLTDHLQEEWIWKEHFTDENEKVSSRIYWQKSGVNVLREADWPELISFFKPRMLALDAFWAEVKDLFEDSE